MTSPIHCPVSISLSALTDIQYEQPVLYLHMLQILAVFS